MAVSKHKPKRPRRRRLKAIWEYVPVPDAKERIFQAYRLLLEDAESDQQEKENIGNPQAK